MILLAYLIYSVDSKDLTRSFLSILNSAFRNRLTFDPQPFSFNLAIYACLPCVLSGVVLTKTEA